MISKWHIASRNGKGGCPGQRGRIRRGCRAQPGRRCPLYARTWLAELAVQNLMITSLKQLAVAQDAGSTFGGAGSQNGHEAGTDAVGGGGSSGEFGGTLQETTGTGLCCGRADVCLCLCPEQPSCGDRQRSEVHTSASSERSGRSSRIVHPDGVPPRRAGRRDQVPAVNAARANGVHPPDIILMLVPLEAA